MKNTKRDLCKHQYKRSKVHTHLKSSKGVTSWGRSARKTNFDQFIPTNYRLVLVQTRKPIPPIESLFCLWQRRSKMEVKALAPTIVTDDTRRPSHVSLETVVFPPLVPFDALLGLSKGQCAFCLTEYIVNSSDEDTKNINVGDSTALPARKNVKKAGASASPALPSDSWIGIIPCCQHRFHFKCISEWAARENRCPWCKLRFRAIGVYDIHQGRSVPALQL